MREATMTTSIRLPEITPRETWEDKSSSPGGIVVGVDGSRESIAALNTAASFARDRDCSLHAVLILQPLPTYRLNPDANATVHDLDALRMSLRESELNDLMHMLEPLPKWTREVIVGSPARDLVQIAEQRGADLIVVGRRRHGSVDRLLGGETTLQVMRMSTVPVLAVDSDLERPHTVVAAVDFSESSLAAANYAVKMTAQPGKVFVVLVDPPLELLPKGFTYPDASSTDVDSREHLIRFAATMDRRAEILVEPIVVNGRPVNALVEFAESVGADLIVAGSHGHSRLDRLLLGSVSTGLVRNSNNAVLVVPGVHGGKGQCQGSPIKSRL
jgi:nucleotide-binding universal stress UspA family protein